MTGVEGGAGPGPLPELKGLWDFSDPAASEGRFREAAARAREAGEEAYALEADTQAARTLGLRRRFEEAHALLDAVEPHLDSHPPVVRVRYLLERGRTLNSSGSPAEALPLFKEAFRIAGEAGLVVLSLDAAHMVAIAAEPAESLEWARRAIAVAEASTDRAARGWLGPLYNNTGWTLHEAGDFAGALELWERGRAFREEAGAPEPLRIARRTVATGLRSLGRAGEALRILEGIHALDAAANEADGYWHEEMAEALLVLGREEEARPRFARALDLLGRDAWLAEHERPRLDRLRRLGGGDSSTRGADLGSPSDGG